MVRLRKAWLPQCNFVGLGHWNWLRSAGYPGPLLKWNICTFQYVSLLQCRLNLNTLKRANCQMLLHIIWWCFSRHDSPSQNIKEKQASLIIFLWLLTKHCLNMVTHTLAWQESISHWMKWRRGERKGGRRTRRRGRAKIWSRWIHSQSLVPSLVNSLAVHLLLLLLFHGNLHVAVVGGVVAVAGHLLRLRLLPLVLRPSVLEPDFHLQVYIQYRSKRGDQAR